MSALRKNVAGQNIPFVLINASTGAALTGATVSAFRSLDGGAQAGAGGTVTEKANGQYLFAPSQADTNANSCGFLFTASGAVPVHFTCFTTAGDPSDAAFAGLSSLTFLTGDSFVRLGAPVGASISADIAAMKSETDTILAAVDTEIASIKAKTDNLPEGIQKNTALNNFGFFMADSADHVTGKTGLAITATRSIDGGAFGACANSAVEVGSGLYRINLATTDVNGDFIVLKFTGAGADATIISFKTEV